MIQTNSPFVKIDPDAARRQALAKVYALLIRLAEQQEKQSVTSEVADNQKLDSEPNLEALIPSTEQSNNFVPLQ